MTFLTSLTNLTSLVFVYILKSFTLSTIATSIFYEIYIIIIIKNQIYFPDLLLEVNYSNIICFIDMLLTLS